MARGGQVDGKAIIYPHRATDSIATVPRWDADDERRYLAGA
jgi:hypothetical protein